MGSLMLNGNSSNLHSNTHLYDLPDAILSTVFSLVQDTRTRNSMSLVCKKWCCLERSTRISLTLRGNVRDLFMIPNCFKSVTNLDLSLLSPWGHSFLDSSPYPSLLPHLLRQAFPVVTNLTIYSRNPSTLQYLAPEWPNLSHVKLVRWHQRSPSPLGSDFLPLFQTCASLNSLDLSNFYCWTEDLPQALQAYPVVSSSLTKLDLLTCSSAEGFKSHELLAISVACPNLRHLLAGCMFDPRVDPEHDGYTAEDARISPLTLEQVFTGLPLLEDCVLDVCHNVRNPGVALEVLNSKCKRLKSLKLGQFHEICRAVEHKLDGIALCQGLETLCIRNSADLNDSGMMAISRGCQKLVKFEITGCKMVTETGLRNLVGMLRKTLVDVKISSCKNIDAACALWALEPIQDKIQRLHIDCIWEEESEEQVVNGGGNLAEECRGGYSSTKMTLDCNGEGNSKTELKYTNGEECSGGNSSLKRSLNCDDGGGNKKKKLKYTNENYWERSWSRLKYLSLWIAVGDLLTPLISAGLEDCPSLEEIVIRVEGDCRRRGRPKEAAFGLASLAQFPQLVKMKLDCGDTIGYALTAPTGQMDLSLWERFYLNGISYLNLNELDYWPPQDRDVNQRSLSLPAAGLLQECATIRKLFIHGTAHEHWLSFLLRIANLRDVQLREDYYPAPEDDMSTEMRVHSCSRFEDALNARRILD
ncbi:F-box/LRR-repeat MAX2 homolog A-like isoform X2 [Papaver somniferum]|uniref:F-box/LRR-repeat MAX2 homolog A-like isoform X2 n=1 Tax=Papaver somniferum TaxID=3469 RepID=UPI000E6FB49A|nr:F-box/LRR-repeat MAX2 homolog A-like isoform X2 [Papaver somniferum]